MRNKVLAIIVATFCFGTSIVIAGTLSCTVTTTNGCPTGVVILKMSSTTNGHAELPSQSNYGNLVCCSGVSGLGNSCSGSFAVALKLSSTTNAHVEVNTQSNYLNDACISADSVSVGYQASNCSGFDTTLASISTSTTNAHIASSSAYTTQVCATASVSSVSCDTNISSAAFGALSTGAVATASNASTTVTCGNALGCTLTIQDAGNGSNPGLATSTAYLIPSNTATLVAGTEGYGIQAATTSVGTGAAITVNTLYNKSGNAVGSLSLTATTLVSSTASFTGREVVVAHLAAISPTTLAESYVDTITYSCLGN